MNLQGFDISNDKSIIYPRGLKENNKHKFHMANTTYSYIILDIGGCVKKHGCANPYYFAVSEK